MQIDQYSQIAEFSSFSSHDIIATINNWAKENNIIITSMCIESIGNKGYNAYVIYNIPESFKPTTELPTRI